MAAYLIYNGLEVTDPDGMADYRSKVGAVMDRFGGRVIAVGTEPEVLEGEWNGRCVLIEFPDMDALRRWYGSEEYKPLLETRLGAASGNVIVLDGL